MLKIFMKDLERLIKKILDDAKKEGAPDRAIIENSLKRFAKIYKTCTNKKEREVEDLISKFMHNRKVCCFEITEVNPTLDKENLMAEIAFNILQRSVNVLMMN